MQDWLDNSLDRLISQSLKSATVVTPEQKRLAWERLRERAASPTAVPTSPAYGESDPSPSVLWLRFVRGGLAAIARLLFDDRRYDRALNHRRTRYPYSMLHAPLRTLFSGVGT